MKASLSKKLILLLEQGTFSGTSFLTNIALVKLLDLEQYGIYASFIIVSHFLLGVSQALVIQPMQVHIGGTDRASSYRFILFLLQCALVFIFSAAIVFVMLADLEFLSFGQLYLLPFALYLVFFLLSDFYRKFFLATGRINLALLIGILYAVSTFGFLAPFIFGQPSEGLATYFYLLAAGYFLPLV